MTTRVALIYFLASTACGKSDKAEPKTDDKPVAKSPVQSSTKTPEKIAAPTSRSGGAITTDGKWIYWIAGTDGRPDTMVERFDVATSTWQSLAPLPSARLNLAAASTGDGVFAIGGMRRVGRKSKQVNVYKDNRWITPGFLPKGLGGVAAAAHDNVVYVFGGNEVLNSSLRDYDAASVDLAFAIRDGGKTVETMAPMPTAREEAAAVTVGDEIYVIGGRVSVSQDDSAIPSRTSAVEIYSPKTNTWTEGPAMPSGGDGRAAAVGDEIVFFGDGALNPDRPLILDVKSKEWRDGEPRDSKTVGSAVDGAVVIDGKLFVVTQVLRGIREPSEPHVFEYDIASDTWTKKY